MFTLVSFVLVSLYLQRFTVFISFGYLIVKVEVYPASSAIIMVVFLFGRLIYHDGLVARPLGPRDLSTTTNREQHPSLRDSHVLHIIPGTLSRLPVLPCTTPVSGNASQSSAQGSTQETSTVLQLECHCACHAHLYE